MEATLEPVVMYQRVYDPGPVWGRGTAKILDAAITAMSGVLGDMIGCLITQSRKKVIRWQQRLRQAADILEDLTK